MSYKIYSMTGNYRGQTCCIAAEFAKVDYQFVALSREELKSEAHLQRHPLGKVPVLEGPEGNLFETYAIVRYLARKADPALNLLGNGDFEQGQVNQWLSFFTSEFAGAYEILMQVWGHAEVNEEAYKKARTEILKKLQIINDHLNHNTYLVGNQLTVADIVFIGMLQYFFSFVLDEGYRRGHASMGRYYRLVMARPQVKKFFRGPFMCQKEWISVKADAKKAEPKKKAETKKAEQPKKAEKKAAPAPEAPPKKPKNPLDELPETSFNLFDFKTYIVNEKDRAKGIAEFWKQYDPKGWSIWHTKYDRYEGEGVKLFLTSNHKDSFLQRLDHFRKYSFGTYGVYGKEGDYEVEGVWVWRGTEIPQEVKDLPSYEYNFWNKLDHENAEHRKMLEEFWSGLENDVSVVNGRTARDVQWFK